MITGILSDIHDHFNNLDKALEIFKDDGAEALIFCGDFCTPIAVRPISLYPSDVHYVFWQRRWEPFRNRLLCKH